jgi:MerR family redox-sensitive transcriptional activator SoxR
MTISEAARQTGLQASAIRYYEQIGLLPAAARVSGQRRYDSSILYRLAIIRRARQLGFTLEEIRQLFFGFRSVTSASQRWRTLNQKKLAELDTLLQGIKGLQRLLRKMMHRCHCETLDQCGRGIFFNGMSTTAGAANSPCNAPGQLSSKKHLRNPRHAAL